MPLFGPPNIEKLKAKQDIEGLIKALRDKNWDICITAAEALGELKDKRAVEALTVALKTRPPRSSHGMKLAQDMHNAADLRGMAALALGEIGDGRAIEALVSALRDDNARAAAEEIHKLDKKSDPPNDQLVSVLTSAIVRVAAATALGDIGDPRAVEPLIAALEDDHKPESVGVSKAAVAALKKIDDARAIEALKKIQQSTSTVEAKARKASFQRYPSSGVCDVCNKNIGPGDAYLVPVSVFYSSRKYKEWLVHGPMSSLFQLTSGSVETYIANARAMDSTSHSAVCSDDIHMFE